MRSIVISRLAALLITAALVPAACQSEEPEGSDTEAIAESEQAHRRGHHHWPWHHDHQRQDDWPIYGHDLHGTRASDDRTISTRNVSRLERKWEVWLPSCTSTPAVVDNRVFVGDWFGNVHAFNARNGAHVWTRNVSRGAVDASPHVTRGVLYIGDGDGYLHALNAYTGAPLWRAEVDPHPAAHVWSSPTVVDGLVLIGSASIEVAIATPPYSFRGSLVAFDARTGRERWRTYVAFDDGVRSGAGVSVWSSFVVDRRRGLAFIGTGQTYEAPSSPLADSLIAVDYRTGRIRWRRQFTPVDLFTIGGGPDRPGPDADIGAHPNLIEVHGRDAVGVGDKAGKYGVFDRDTGEPLWTPAFRQVSTGSAQGGFMDSAAYAKDTLFMASNDSVVVLDNPLPTDAHILQAVDANTGDTIWRHRKPNASVGGVAYANGVLFNITTDGSIYAASARTGEELWRDRMSTVNPISGQRRTALAASGPSVAAGKVFACSGFSFVATAGLDTIQGGLIAYGLPDRHDPPPTDGGTTTPTCATPAGVAQCLAAEAEPGCENVVNCECQNCACQLEACRADADCAAILQCVRDTGCSGVSCYQRATCQAVIEAHGGAQGRGQLLASAADSCSTRSGCPNTCSSP